MLEIDLSRLTIAQSLDPEAFDREVLENANNRVWLSSPAPSDAWRASRDELKAHVHRVNREIEEARARQDAKLVAMRTVLETKAQNKAVYREQLRRPYANELAALPGLVTPNTIAQRLAEFERRNQDAIAEELGAIESQPLRALLADYHPNAWVYGVHPVLWQLGVYEYFIQSREAGFRFNQRDVAAWVRDRYGVEKSVYRLFLAQYKARSAARQGGFFKNRISAWYFTEAENADIPNFYRPVNRLMDKLVAIGLLLNDPVVIGGLVKR